jgi:hypothetical protein
LEDTENVSRKCFLGDSLKEAINFEGRNQNVSRKSYERLKNVKSKDLVQKLRELHVFKGNSGKEYNEVSRILEGACRSKVTKEKID